MNNLDFKDKQVLVMGLGRFGGGLDVARFAAARAAKVTVTDLATADKLRESINQLQDLPGIELHLGGHDPEDFERAEVIVANPAVPPDNRFLQTARRQGKLVTSQVEIFFQLCPALIIGITGANGKSTTTALTAHILDSARSPSRAGPTPGESVRAPGPVLNSSYEKVLLGGNIGNRPLLAELDRIGPEDIVVLELSSFQLEQLAAIETAPGIALLTNLTPNHLDRHGTFAAYCAAKENIFKYQRPGERGPAVSIFNAEDQVAAKWFEKYQGQAGRVCIGFSTADVPQPLRDAFGLPGRANLSNLAAALAVAGVLGLSRQRIAECLDAFRALPHRLEFVRSVRGVRWYNDSIATTGQSAVAALEAFDCPRIIIAGGYDKKLGFDELGRKVAESAKAAVLLGQTAPKIAAAIRAAAPTQAPQIEFARSLAEAVKLAAAIAEPGDVVLLSPACASYDMFENFQQRGKAFVRLVRQL